MDNRSVLAEVLEGVENSKEFTFEIYEKEVTIEVKPIPESGLLKLQTIETGNQRGIMRITKGMSREEIQEQARQIEDPGTQDMEYNINNSDLIMNVANTKYAAIEMGTGLQKKDVGQLTRKIINDLFEFIMEISSITKDDLNILKEFRKDRKG
jgi:hypothetical protein